MWMNTDGYLYASNVLICFVVQWQSAWNANNLHPGDRIHHFVCNNFSNRIAAVAFHYYYLSMRCEFSRKSQNSWWLVNGMGTFKFYNIICNGCVKYMYQIGLYGIFGMHFMDYYYNFYWHIACIWYKAN